jgi:hypothetical protein
MTKIKAYMADHHDIAKTLLDMMEVFVIAAVCLGTTPAIIYFTMH